MLPVSSSCHVRRNLTHRWRRRLRTSAAFTVILQILIQFKDANCQTAQIFLLVLPSGIRSTRRCPLCPCYRIFSEIRCLLVVLVRQFTVQSAHVAVDMHNVALLILFQKTLTFFTPNFLESIAHGTTIESTPFGKYNNMIRFFRYSPHLQFVRQNLHHCNVCSSSAIQPHSSGPRHSVIVLQSVACNMPSSKASSDAVAPAAKYTILCLLISPKTGLNGGCQRNWPRDCPVWHL